MFGSEIPNVEARSQARLEITNKKYRQKTSSLVLAQFSRVFIDLSYSWLSLEVSFVARIGGKQNVVARAIVRNRFYTGLRGSCLWVVPVAAFGFRMTSWGKSVIHT